MMARARYVAPSTRAMILTSLLAACGSYDNASKAPGTGGTSSTGGASTGGTSTGGTSTGGVNATGGVATGGTMSTPTGGSSPTGGQAPNGGSGGGEGGASGGGTGKGACTETAPCGGDPVGTWISESCEIAIGGKTDVGPVGIGCKSADVKGSITVIGAFTVTADGKYTDATTTKGTAAFELEKACLEVSGFQASCDRLAFETIGLTKVVCVDNAMTAGCSCTATIEQAGNMAWIALAPSTYGPEGSKGTYTAADNKLVATTEFSDVAEYSYCVAGDTMSVTPITPSTVGTFTGPIVFKKQ
jgi:hypothetical protein